MVNDGRMYCKTQTVLEMSIWIKLSLGAHFDCGSTRTQRRSSSNPTLTRKNVVNIIVNISEKFSIFFFTRMLHFTVSVVW